MIQIIPAIDIIDGACVRLTQGDYAQKTRYAANPVDMAKQFEAIGLTRLHLVDLDGAKASRPCNLRVLEQIASSTSLEVEFGGGIKSAESLEQVFAAGATYAIGGSVAVTCPDEFGEWIERFGAGRIMLGVDVKHGMVATHGWLKTSQVTAVQLITKFPAVSQVICTDIAVDGMLGGVNKDFYVALQQQFPAVTVTVSGGIGSTDDISRLDEAGLKRVIVGKALYEGRITTKDLQRYVG